MGKVKVKRPTYRSSLQWRSQKQSPEKTTAAHSKKINTFIIAGDCFTTFLFVTSMSIAFVVYYSDILEVVRNVRALCGLCATAFQAVFF